MNKVKDFEYKEPKDTPLEKQEEKRIQKVEDSVRSLWDNFKYANIRILGVPEEETVQDTENILEEIISENFPHLVKYLVLHVQEAYRITNKRNPKRNTPSHIIFKIQGQNTKRGSYKQQEKGSWLPRREHPYNYQLISQQKLYRPDGTGKKCSK